MTLKVIFWGGWMVDQNSPHKDGVGTGAELDKLYYNFIKSRLGKISNSQIFEILISHSISEIWAQSLHVILEHTG